MAAPCGGIAQLSCQSLDWLQKCLKMFISSTTAQRGQHTHTHTHVKFSNLWGHLINVMLSLAPYPNHNPIITLALKPHFKSQKCLQTCGVQDFGPHKYSKLPIFGLHKDVNICSHTHKHTWYSRCVDYQVCTQTEFS